LSIIRSDQFETFFARPLKGVAKFLLHGNDADVASERARRLVPLLVDDAADPFQLVRLSSDTLAKDPGRLADEASAISMFGGKRVIWIEAGGRDLSALVAPIFDALPEGTSLLIEADNLKKGAPLRTLFESRPDAASIECYAPQAASLGQMIDAEAAKAGVRLGAQAREHLVSTLSLDPSAARSEIAKLMLYAGDGGALEPADIDAVAANAGVSPADALVDLALSGDLAGLERAAASGLADSGDAALAAMRLASRVTLMMELRQGGGEPPAFQRLPFMVKKTVLAQANSWAPEALAQRLPALLNLLATTRRSPALASAQAFRALTSFAIAARRGAR
jgi:DNA polymerase-3 subunit delta